MFTSFTKKKKIVAGLLLSIQIGVQLFAPISFALAAPGSTAVQTVAPGDSASTSWYTTALNWVKKKAGAVIDYALDATIGNALKFIAWAFFEVAGVFFAVSAAVLDMSIDKTVDSGMYKGLSAIQVGWTAIRDISNMFFIFVLLYIAILTILGMAGSNTKRWVGQLIIAAVLINFSLFATQVVVDAGNILTVGFWNKITTTTASGTHGGFAPVLMEGLKVQTAFNGGEGDNTTKAKIYFGGALVMFIAGYVAFAGAIMMIIRTVTLIILMIVSPFAFLGFSLPKGGGFASQWLSKLLGATFVAPVFVIMLYLNTIIIRSIDITNLGGAGGSNFAAVAAGDVSNFAIIYNFAVIIILLLSSLTVADYVSDKMASGASGWAKKIIGYGGAATFAGVAMAGRQTAGRYAKSKSSNDEWVKAQNRLVANAGMQGASLKDKLKGRAANLKLATAEKTAKGTFDIRNAPMGGLGVTSALGKVGVSTGTGSKKSYDTHGQVGSSLTGAYRGTENEKQIIATAEERFKGDPAARKAYMEQRGVDLSATRNKDANTKLNRDQKKSDAKSELETSDQKRKDLQKEVDAGTKTKEQAEIEGKTIGESVKQAMLQLSSSERAELAEKHSGNSDFINNLNKGDLAQIHKLEIDGKYSTPVLQSVSESVMLGNNVQLQEHIMKPENQDRLFAINYDKIAGDEKLMANYNRAKNKVTEDAKKAKSNRWSELFAKGTSRTPAEEAEMKTLNGI